MSITSTKKIICTDGKCIVTEHYALMRKASRVGSVGKNIKCPHCERTVRAFNLSFSSLTCPTCKTDVPKYEWMIERGS